MNGLNPSNLRPGRASSVRQAMLLLWLGLVFLLLGTAIGSQGWEPMAQALGLHAGPDSDIARQILLDIRLPRSLGAWLAGALLGLAGALAQGLFRNPLADPYLLGSASGAVLGVALALVLATSSLASSPWLLRLGLNGAAFVGALLAVLLTLLLAQGVQHTLRLLLAGVIVGVVLGAIKELLTLAAPETLRPLQGFMLGSTGLLGWPAVALLAAVWLPCALAAWGLSRGLDALALGEASAASLGLPLAALRAALVLLLALATGCAVAQTGLIAFVGLAAPHLVRALGSRRSSALLCLSSLVGGALLLGADVLARGLLAPRELPVGVLTALFGGGYLLALMYRHRPGQGF